LRGRHCLVDQVKRLYFKAMPDGIVCTGESYKQIVKLTFARGASIKDPEKLFNSSLEGNTRRAIDLREGEKIQEAAFKQLIRDAVAANSAARAQRAAKKK
jgi:hypothetical protein